MTLIVEDGSNVAGAESYGSTAQADTYHANRGNDAWALLVTLKKEQSLRQATDFLVGAYRQRWSGARTTLSQALDFPRYLVPLRDVPGGGSYPGYLLPSVVPNEVKNACFELALRASVAALNPDLSRGVLSEKVGLLEVVYDPNSSQRVRYPQIDEMLQPYLKGGGGTLVSLSR